MDICFNALRADTIQSWTALNLGKDNKLEQLRPVLAALCLQHNRVHTAESVMWSAFTMSHQFVDGCTLTVSKVGLHSDWLKVGLHANYHAACLVPPRQLRSAEQRLDKAHYESRQTRSRAYGGDDTALMWD